jgi:ABC-type Mn2+/Zn2+ transport system ATPase subunit
MTSWTEDDLIEILGGILLNHDEEIDGLDDDLVAYLSGLLSTELSEDPGQAEDILDESMLPFLESVGCPSNLMEKAKAAILAKAAHAEPADAPQEGARKLEQGIVSMSATLTKLSDEDADRNSWGPGEKARANTQMDAYSENSSSKDRRNQKKELVKTRRDLALQYQVEESSTKAGVSSMLLPTVMSKDKDVQLQNITLALDNGTILLEKGDLKFTYKRRYGLIGENGVGKTTLLGRIANWQDLEGFPRHLRVLHVRQELHMDSEETSVLQAVLEADVERQTLLDEEKDLLARLEGAGGGTEDLLLSVAEKRKRLELQKEQNVSFGDDLKKLNEVYERLQLLGADSAQSRAAMILSGLQFSPEMQLASISSLSGGWRMRVALAAALLIEPDLLLLDEPTNHLDLEAVIWLERYLVDYPHTVIIVSHDRGFLNFVCTDIIEFKKKKLTCTYWRLRGACGLLDTTGIFSHLLSSFKRLPR